MYVTRTQIVQKFGESVLIALTDRAGLGVIDDAALDVALASAEAKVNGYIGGGGRYALPLSPVTEDVIDAVFAILRYNLDGEQGNDIVTSRYDAAVAWLKDVSAGRVALAGASAVATVAPSANRIEIVSAQTVFARGRRD